MRYFASCVYKNIPTYAEKIECESYQKRQSVSIVYLIGKPLVVPGRTPAIPCCVIGLSMTLTLNCLEDDRPVLERASPESILVRREPAVGARFDSKEADGGLARA